MKKASNFILALLITLLAAMPATLSALAIPEPYWYTANNSLSALGLDSPEDDPTLINAVGDVEHGSGANGTFGAGYNCTGEGCGEITVYIHIEVTVTWEENFTENDYQYIHYEWGSLGVGTAGDEDVNCYTQYQESGTCSFEADMEMTGEEVGSFYDYTRGEEAEANGWVSWVLNGVTTLAGLYLHSWIDISISSEPIQGSGYGSNCADQYLLGPEIGSFTLSSQNAAGENLERMAGMDYPAPGEWMAIRITDGYWKNQGEGPDLRDIAMKQGISGTWMPLDIHPVTGCYDEASSTYYVQMSTSTLAYYLRVYDTDADFPSNTGDLDITLYSISTFSRYPTGCELNYMIGEFIETKTVAGDFSNGLPMDQAGREWDPRGGTVDYFVPIRYYMIETYGGPVNLGSGSYTYTADLGLLDDKYDLSPDEWENINTASFVECVVPTDQVGHVRAFVAVDERIAQYDFERYWYAFRVRDTGDYADNTGSLSYRLYYATNLQVITPGTEPEENGCIQFASEETETSSTVLYGTDQNGERLGTGVFTSGTIYRIEVEDGPWKDDGVDSYAIEISSDDGDNWYDLEDYPYLLCSQSADGDHYLIYVNGVSGQVWRARVADGNDDFTDNSDSITVSVYAGYTGIDPFPTCEENYTLTYVRNDTIPGNIEDGKIIPEITAGNLYSIKVTDDMQWYDDGGTTGSYLLQISSDGGETWENLEEMTSLCTEQIANYGLFQVYFTAEAGQYRLRVQDDDNFPANTGGVVIELYSAIDTGNPTPTDGDLPPQWVVSCYEIQDRPDSVIEWYGIVPVPRVAAWLDYIRYAITYFFAWCPEHTAMLESVGNYYTDKEPIASLLQLIDFVRSMQTIIDSYSSLGGEGEELDSMEPDLFADLDNMGEPTGGAGSNYSTNPLDIFVVGNINTTDNIWFGGELDLTANPVDLSGMSDYQEVCESKFYSLFGITTSAYCSLMGAVRFTKIATWLLLGIDLILIVIWVFKYFPGWIRRFLDVLTGQKKMFSRFM